MKLDKVLDKVADDRSGAAELRAGVKLDHRQLQRPIIRDSLSWLTRFAYI